MLQTRSAHSAGAPERWPADTPTHDPGPDSAWSGLFARAPVEKYQQHASRFRLEFGPVFYRGRLDGTARVLVVGEAPGPDELVCHRVFVGAAGQRLQGFLRRVGCVRDYLMMNAFLYPVFGPFVGELRDLGRDPQIQGYRNEMLDYIAQRSPLEAVVTLGPAARDAVERWPGRAATPVQHLAAPSGHGTEALLESWNDALARLRGLLRREAGAPADDAIYGAAFVPEDLADVPRRDLPFGVPPWHGVGRHARRGALGNGMTHHKELVWTAP